MKKKKRGKKVRRKHRHGGQQPSSTAIGNRGSDYSGGGALSLEENFPVLPSTATSTVGATEIHFAVSTSSSGPQPTSPEDLTGAKPTALEAIAEEPTAIVRKKKTGTRRKRRSKKGRPIILNVWK